MHGTLKALDFKNPKGITMGCIDDLNPGITIEAVSILRFCLKNTHNNFLERFRTIEWSISAKGGLGYSLSCIRRVILFFTVLVWIQSNILVHILLRLPSTL
jgi:hypothetical protein